MCGFSTSRVAVPLVACVATTSFPEASFKEDLGADSLDLFELVMSFEDEFGVEIPTEMSGKSLLID